MLPPTYLHFDSTVFPNKVLERRPGQDTLMGCAGLHNKKIWKY
jgi:hypothetical protein